MIQLFTPEVMRDPNEEKAFNVFKAMVEPFKNAVLSYYENAYSSIELGNIIYGGNVSPITNILKSPRIPFMYPSWHGLYQDIETHDYLIELIISLYKTAVARIDKIGPEILSFNIGVKDLLDMWWNRDSCFNKITTEESDIEVDIFIKDSEELETENSTGIVFSQIAYFLPADSLMSVLKDVVYPGLYYTVELYK